jgi:hypothetical protein
MDNIVHTVPLVYVEEGRSEMKMVEGEMVDPRKIDADGMN